MLNIVHTTNNYLNPQINMKKNLEKRKHDFYFAFSNVIKHCLSKSIDVLIISGIFFDKNLIDKELLEKIKEQFKNLNKSKIVIFDYSIYSNDYNRFHEYNNLQSEFKNFDNVIYIDWKKEKFEPETLNIKGEKLHIYYHTDYNHISFLDFLEKEEVKPEFSIFLENHSNDIFSNFLKDIALEEKLSMDKEKYNYFFEKFFSKGFNYVGLTYNNNLVRKQFGKTIVCCPGSTEKYRATDFKVEKGFLQFTNKVDSVDNIKFKKIKTRKIEIIEIECSIFTTNIERVILEKAKKIKNKNVIYNIVLTGIVFFDVYYEFKLNCKKFEKFNDNCFSFVITDLLDIEDDSFIITNFKFLKPKKMFERYISDLMINKDENEKQTYKKIKELGLEIL